MQFNNTIYAIFNSYNSLGEEVFVKKLQLKCRIISKTKKLKNFTSASKHDEEFDIHFVVPHREFEPYSMFMTNDVIAIEHAGVKYDIKSISVIPSFSGKAKYYEVKGSEQDAN